MTEKIDLPIAYGDIHTDIVTLLENAAAPPRVALMH